MTAQEFKMARRGRGWTQNDIARHLGVSQTYVALLERGKRNFTAKLARKAVTALQLSPVSLPVRAEMVRAETEGETLARQLAALGYPGFLHLRPLHKRNPAEVLLTALSQENLESRLAEALPWLMLKYSEMTDVCGEWLLEQARLRTLTNRLGFVVSTAKQVLETRGETTTQRYRALTQMEQQLFPSRLAEEDTLCQASLSRPERAWLSENRPETARAWNVLTNWKPEHLQYA